MKLSLRTKLAIGCLLAVFGRADAQEYRYPVMPVSQSQPGGAVAPETLPEHQPAVRPGTDASSFGTAGTAPGLAHIDNGIPYQNYTPCTSCLEAAPAAECDTGCLFNTGTPWTMGSLLFGEDSQYNFGGWTQLGYHTRSNGIFNDQPGRVNLHQTWLYSERVADGSQGLDWGYRMDVIYGIDGANTQAFGNPPGTWDFRNGFGDGPREAWAIPQLYGELAYGNTSVIMGHFYTILGYEVVPATGNFFYSHAFTFNFSEPFTHTGALATTTLMDGALTLFNGFSLGIDTGFNQVGNGGNYLGGFSYNVLDNVSVGYTTAVGDLGFVGNGFFGTALLDVSMFDGAFNWVVQNDVAYHEAGITRDNFESVGIVNYLFYNMNDCWRFGNRSEWYRVEGVDYYAVTAGMNFIPHSNLIIRPEYRYQWSPQGKAGNNVLDVPVDLGIFGIDMILTY